MIINQSYTIRILDTTENFITNAYVGNTDLCGVTFDSESVTVNTRDILGQTVLTVSDKEGKRKFIDIIVDNIDYEYELKLNGNTVDEKNPAVIFYNSNDRTELLEIVEKRYSHLFNRYISQNEGDGWDSGDFTVNFTYEQSNDGITIQKTIDKTKLQIDTLSPLSQTDVKLSFTAADKSTSTQSFKICVIDGEKLSIVPSKNNTITLDERDTSINYFTIFGTENEINVSYPQGKLGFDHILDGNKIGFKILGANENGSQINFSSFWNGNNKTETMFLYIRPFELTTNTTTRRIIEVGEKLNINVYQVIGDISVEGINDTIDKFTYSVVYDRTNYSAVISIIATDVSDLSFIKIIDTVTDRTPRTVNVPVKFVKDISITVLTPTVVALDAPGKIKFENAFGDIKIITLSKLTGKNIGTTMEYDIDPYTGETIRTSGFIFVHPIVKDEIIIRIADSRSYEDGAMTVEPYPYNIGQWIPIIDTEIKQQDLSNTLGSEPIYSNAQLKAGDFVGNTWIEGYKYGTSKIKTIRYKVSPPNSIVNNSAESLNWLKNLANTTTTVKISIRDGFILESQNKDYTVSAHWVNENVFETEDLSSYEIIMQNAETMLFTDTTNRISLTTTQNNDGVIIYIDENNEENVSSRLNVEPISFITINQIKPANKIPMNKPSSCYDIKRLDPSVVNGEFKIFPAAGSDENLQVLCEFNKDVNGNDDIWTIIPERSIKLFADIIGDVKGEAGNELKLTSNGGIHPEFYPNAYESNDSLSYLFFNFPYKIKSFGYKLGTVETDENSAGTFKILTDTSDVFHINGTVSSNSMRTRRGTTIEFDESLITKNLGQVVSLPQGFENYEYSINNTDGIITPETPTDRIVIMNSGTATPFTLSETFLKELRFKSIFNAENLTNEYWLDSSGGGIDLDGFYSLSTEYNAVVSEKTSKIIELAEFIKVLPAGFEYNISKSNTNDIAELSEFITIKSDEFVFNISNVDSFVINTQTEYSMTTDLDNIISNLDSNIIELSTLDLDNVTKLDTKINSDYHDFNISFIQSHTMEFKQNVIFSTYQELTTDKEKTTNYIISNNNNVVSNLAEYVKLSVVRPHDTIISVVKDDTTVTEINSMIKLSSNASNREIISHDDTYTIQINEYVKLSTSHDFNIITVIKNDKTVSEIVTRTYFDAYHPVNIALLDSTVSNVSDSNNSILKPNIREIISPKQSDILNFEIQVNNHMLVDGHNPALPYTIYQDGRKAEVYNDETEINFINLDYIGTETDIITNIITEPMINFNNMEFIGYSQDIVTIYTVTTTAEMNIPNLEYTGSEIDIVSLADIVTSSEMNLVNMLYTGTETDIIDQKNDDILIPLTSTNLLYSPMERDISSQVDSTIITDLVSVIGKEYVAISETEKTIFKLENSDYTEILKQPSSNLIVILSPEHKWTGTVRNETIDNYNIAVGRLGGSETAQTTYSFGPAMANKEIDVTYTVFRIDSWDSGDYVIVKLNTLSEEFRAYNYGDSSGGWSYMPEANLFGGWDIEMYQTKTSRVLLNAAGDLTISVLSRLNQSFDDKSVMLGDVTFKLTNEETSIVEYFDGTTWQEFTELRLDTLSVPSIKIRASNLALLEYIKTPKKVVEINMVNLGFEAVQSFMVRQNTTSTIDLYDNQLTTISDNSRLYTVTNKSSNIMDLGENVSAKLDNRYVVSQKDQQFGMLEDAVKVHIPQPIKTDVIVEADFIEFTSPNNDKKLVAVYTEGDIREVNVLDITINSNVDEVRINTFKNTNIETIETISIV